MNSERKNRIHPNCAVQTFETIWQSVLVDQNIIIDTDVVEPIYDFLQYVIDEHNLVLHGSNISNIATLSPVQAGGVEADQALAAVYATDSAPEAIFFAILDRPKVGSFSSETYGTQYQVDKFTAADPWRNGTVYLLPRDKFNKIGGYWVCDQPISPKFAINVGPTDFPYLDQVQQNHLPWYDQWVFRTMKLWHTRIYPAWRLRNT